MEVLENVNRVKGVGRGGHNFKDITGQRFGKLVVQKLVGTNARGYTVWSSLCDCGGTHIATGHDLRRRHVLSCKRCRQIDLTGQQFGSLTVIRRVGEKMWECQCSCGVTLSVDSCWLRERRDELNACLACRGKRSQAEKEAKRKAVREARTSTQEADCYICGNHFVYTTLDGKARKYCSWRCMKRRICVQRTRIKRARAMKSPKIERVDVFAVLYRDNYICQRCGCHTPLSLYGTREPNAPECDHVIAFINHGEHTYTNTQDLCRECNAWKRVHVDGIAGNRETGAKVTAEQVREMRRLYATGQVTQAILGKQFNLSRGAIADIIYARTWKDVGLSADTATLQPVFVQ